MAGATHFYVWYAVTSDRSDAARAVAALIAAVEDTTGVAGRVLARRDDASTWMEIYENVADAAAFELALAAAVQRHEAADFAEGRARGTRRGWRRVRGYSGDARGAR